MQAMGVDDVTAALKALALDTAVFAFDSSTATSQQAAENVGCQLGQIVKSLGFMISKTTPMLVLVSGDQTIDDRKLGAQLGVSRKRVRMMTAQQCLEILGYAPGGVPPIAHRSEGISVYLDSSLKRYETVYAAAGSANAIFPISLAKLQKVTGGAFADLVKQ